MPKESTPKSVQPTSSQAASALETETRLLELLEKNIASTWSSKISLEVDGKPVKFDSCSMARSSRHHVNFEIQCKASLVGAGKHQLVIADVNFLEVTEVEATDQKTFHHYGGVKTAFRAKGNAMLINSNAAAVLSRSKVSETQGLDLNQRVLLSTIKAEIVLMNPTEKVNRDKPNLSGK